MVARITFSYEEWTGIYQTEARNAPNHLPVYKQPPITKNYPINIITRKLRIPELMSNINSGFPQDN